MSAPALKLHAAPRYEASKVAAAIERHALLNRRAISIMSIEFSEDGSRTWTIAFADETRIVTEEWIEDPRPVDVTKADIFHDGVRLGLRA